MARRKRWVKGQPLAPYTRADRERAIREAVAYGRALGYIVPVVRR